MQSWFLECISSLSYRCLDLLYCFQSHFCRIPARYYHIDRRRTTCFGSLQRHWQFLFLMYCLRLFHFEYSSFLRFYARNVLDSFEVFEYYLNLFLPFCFFAQIFQSLSLTFGSVSSFFNKPSNLHIFLWDFIIKNFGIHAALGTGCVVLDLLAVRLIRLRVCSPRSRWQTVLQHPYRTWDCDRACHLVCYHAIDVLGVLHLLLLYPLLPSDFFDCATAFFSFFFFASASVISAVFSFLCFRSVSAATAFAFIFSMISRYLISNVDSSSPTLLSACFGLFCFVVPSLSLFDSWGLSWFGVLITNIAMTHLWSLPMWIMTLASASLLYFRCLLLIKIQSICFSVPSGDL